MYRSVCLSTGFPIQFADVTAEGISTAGFSGYALICNISREPDLPPTSTLAVQWLDPRGNVISSGENFTISSAGPTTDIRLISRLVFNSLYTSQAGDYTCRTLQTIPGIVRNHPEPVTFTIQVKCKLSAAVYNITIVKCVSDNNSLSMQCLLPSYL